MEVKNPKTYEEQLNLLIKRGCLVENRVMALAFLQNVNYYRLTAYFLPYKNLDNTYRSGTVFENVCHSYRFDKIMRSILVPVIEDIEIMLRTRLAYYFGHKYGPLGYLEGSNFSKVHRHNDFLDHIEKSIQHNSNQFFVRHHIRAYDGKFPIWVIIELFTIGELSFFYADMKTDDQKSIARESFKTWEANLVNWLHCLTILRNSCAHYSRLYYYLFPVTPVTPEGFPHALGRRLFDYILVLKFLYQDKRNWNNVFLVQLEALIESYKEYIDLSLIGFPDNWLELLRN